MLEDMLRACMLDFKRLREGHIPLIEFVYNNGYQVTIQMASYEALYGRKCRSSICWDEAREAKVIGLEIFEEMTEQCKLIQARMATAQSRQKSYADNRRKELIFKDGDWVYLLESPVKGVSIWAEKKLSPRYNGPYQVMEKVGLITY